MVYYDDISFHIFLFLFMEIPAIHFLPVDYIQYGQM